MKVRDCGRQDYDGTCADACGIGGVLPFPTHALGRLAVVEGVSAWGDPLGLSVRPLGETGHEL